MTDRKTWPKLAGVLNVSPDSFSGDGVRDSKVALARAEQMRRDGADVIDLGAVSTRPGFNPVSTEEELARLDPIIRSLSGSDLPFSVDTSNPLVMRRAIDSGARMINDVFALRNPGALEVIRDSAVDIVLMHAPGSSSDQLHAVVDDPVPVAIEFLSRRIDACLSAGIDPRRIWIDPGIGFVGGGEMNLRLLRSIPRFAALHPQVYVGVSRKRFLDRYLVPCHPEPERQRSVRLVPKRSEGETKKSNHSQDRLYAGIGLALALIPLGVRYLRVHDVRETAEAMRTFTDTVYV